MTTSILLRKDICVTDLEFVPSLAQKLNNAYHPMLRDQGLPVPVDHSKSNSPNTVAGAPNPAMTSRPAA